MSTLPEKIKARIMTLTGEEPVVMQLNREAEAINQIIT